MNNKGQTGGLITALVFGIASLIIGVIIAFVIVSTLTGANLLTSTRTTNTVVNETSSWLNATNYTLAGASGNYVPGTFTLTAIWNASTGGAGVYNLTIPLAQANVFSNGVVNSSNATSYTNVSLSYRNTVKSAEELSADRLDANFSAGVDNISGKIPTVLLVAAIVLILAVLAILVGVWARMRMGGGTTL